MDLQNGSGNVGRHRRRLLAAMETGGTGFSADAAEHAWRPLTFTLALSLSHMRRGRGNGAWLERKKIGTPSRNGCTGTVRAR